MIEIKSLDVKYGEFTAVNDLNIKIEEGEFFTFLGPSGCGKTTTLRCISGFEKAAKGDVYVAGESITGLLPEERNLGFVFQSYALFPSMNVYENIAFGLRAHKVNKKIIRSKVENVAKRTGIEEHLQKKISELSGGQQQRIAIARALVLEPRILLMDEPLSNLDAKLRVSMREEIKRLQKELGITTVYVTHDQEEALAISDRIAVFNHGSLEQVGTPQEVYFTPKTEFVAKFIGDINAIEHNAKKIVCKKWPELVNRKIYIRPEKTHILSKEDKDDKIHMLGATIIGFEFQGAYAKAKIELEGGGKGYSLIFQREQTFQVGEEVIVELNKENFICFGGEKNDA